MNAKSLNLLAAALMLATGVTLAAEQPAKPEITPPAVTNTAPLAKPTLPEVKAPVAKAEDATKYATPDAKAATGKAEEATKPAMKAEEGVKSASVPAFDSLDRNHDGALSADELKDVKTVDFAKLDANKDGKLSREEYTSAHHGAKASDKSSSVKPVETTKKS